MSRQTEIQGRGEASKSATSAMLIRISPSLTAVVAIKKLVRPTGFEPVAPRLGIWCSILLSYGRVGLNRAVPGEYRRLHQTSIGSACNGLLVNC